MSPEEAQRKLDNDLNVYNIGEEDEVFNLSKLEKAERIIKKMKIEFEQARQYDYKTMHELYHMNIRELQEELERVTHYTNTLKKFMENTEIELEQVRQYTMNIEEVRNHLESRNSTKQVNQIKRRSK